MSEERMPESDVLVIGEALIDIVDDGGGPAEHVGGSPANVALGLGRRGVRVSLLTQLADDDHGRMIIEHLEASGVRVLAESMSAVSTSTAHARIAAHGQAEYDFDVSWDGFTAPRAFGARLLHTGSLAAFLEPGAASVRDLLSRASAQEITFDPNIRPALIEGREAAVAAFEASAALATVVKMSDQDAAWLYRDATPDRVLDEMLALGPALAALTLGAEGAIVATAEHRVVIPPVSIAAVDTIGAGDTFMASLIASVLETGSAGLDRPALELIGRDAARAAAITVSRAGADLPWESEL